MPDQLIYTDLLTICHAIKVVHVDVVASLCFQELSSGISCTLKGLAITIQQLVNDQLIH